MADFSLTTLFVVPAGQTALPTTGSTQDLTAGQVGIFRNDYTLATAGNIAAAPYFYIAQGRENTYLQASKRSDKINAANVLEWYKVNGVGVPTDQITDVSGFSLQCGETLSLTLRAHSNYIDTLYFNGLTRSVTVNTPCCDCGADPCTDTDVPTLIDSLIAKLEESAPGINADNIKLTDFFTFVRVGADASAILRITGKPLTKYGVPCDVAAFPYEYDRMWFDTFVYEGPDTTADFIVSDACDIVATTAITQKSNYATGLTEEIRQMEINFYSYQAGYLKHQYRMAGYNQNVESYVQPGAVYDTYYLKFNEVNRNHQNWGDYVPGDSTVIIAAIVGSAVATAIEAVLTPALGAPKVINA